MLPRPALAPWRGTYAFVTCGSNVRIGYTLSHGASSVQGVKIVMVLLSPPSGAIRGWFLGLPHTGAGSLDGIQDVSRGCYNPATTYL